MHRTPLAVRPLLTLALCLAACASQAQTKQDPDYVAGLQAWEQEKYPLASEHLSRYRVSAAYGKSYDIDYLLGTAWCRMPGMAAKGASLLDWAMQQDMPDSAARLFRAEWQVCQSRATTAAASAAIAAASRPQVLARTSVGAGASVRASGKMYYVVNGDKGSFAAYPLELVQPRPESEYAARLFALDAPQQAAEALRQRMGPGYRVLAVGRFLLSSPTHSEAELRTIAGRLEHFAGFLSREYGMAFAPRFITVHLAPTPQRMVAMALQVHGLRASEMTLGYTFQNDLSVSAMMQTTAAGTLLHELFHLGVRANFGDIPSWLDESLASLYETSTAVGDTYLGEPNWRGHVLQTMGVSRGVRLRELVGYLSADRVDVPRGEAMERMRPDEAAYEAALGRYFVLYLQEQRQLKAVYQAFANKPAWAQTMPAREAAIKLIEEATGQILPQIEKAFGAWLKVATGDPNWRPARPDGGISVPKELPITR